MKAGYSDVTRMADLSSQLKNYGLELYNYQGKWKVASPGMDYFTCDPVFVAATKREVQVWIYGYESGMKVNEKEEECES